MRRIMVVGLTGPSGSGKSTAAAFFKELGFEVIDADKVAQRVIESDEHCLNELAKAFGQDIINPDGTLNRPLLARRAFKNSQSNKKLNDITHPIIIEEVKSMIGALAAKGVRAVVVDAALLFESGADGMCDYVVTVIASESIRLKRIIERDKIGEEAARLRINAQNSQNYYVNKAHFAIINDEDMDRLKDRVATVTRMMLEDFDESRI